MISIYIFYDIWQRFYFNVARLWRRTLEIPKFITPRTDFIERPDYTSIIEGAMDALDLILLNITQLTWLPQIIAAFHSRFEVTPRC